MVNSLLRFKNRLATIRMGSLRYKLGTSLWNDNKIRNAHACSFYWWYLPSTLVAWFFIGIAGLLFLLFTYLIVIPVGWLLGRVPKSLGPETIYEDHGRGWHDYGYAPIVKKHYRVAPQQVVLGVLALIAAIALLVTFSGDIQWGEIALVVGIVVGFIALVTGIGWLFSRNATKDLWNRVCPDLKVLRENGS